MWEFIGTYFVKIISLNHSLATYLNEPNVPPCMFFAFFVMHCNIPGFHHPARLQSV